MIWQNLGLYSCESQKKQDKAQLEFPREPQCRSSAGFIGLHPAHKSVGGDFKPRPALPGQPGSPRLMHRASCPVPALPPIFHIPSLLPPVITRSKRFFPLHIFLFLSVRCGKPNRMITQRVPCVCCLPGGHSRDDKWEREEFKKHQMAQKAAGANRVQPHCGFAGLDRAAKPTDKYSDVPLVCQQAIGKNLFALFLEE